MRELLKEARALLARMHDHLMELTAKLPMQYFGLVDSGLIQNAGNLIERINTELAMPAPDAMEIVDKLEKLLNMDQAVFPPTESYTEAAALIESYNKQAPRVTLDAMEIVDKIREPVRINLEEIKETETEIKITYEIEYKIGKPEAAALIEQQSRVVPRAMLREVYAAGWDDGKEDDSITSLEALAEKYGYKVEG